ncbi:MAG: hypothetical protein UR26_C0003G0068 [candidate division TM6 bacterium GW2011_GWF2_32_72]|nr:MAG: hypothetical protein UR26_C0003G0068 [candidate division TM6 bacterium GW2011_GWF2_32_72]
MNIIKTRIIIFSVCFFANSIFSSSMELPFFGVVKFNNQPILINNKKEFDLGPLRVENLLATQQRKKKFITGTVLFLDKVANIESDEITPEKISFNLKFAQDLKINIWPNYSINTNSLQLVISTLKDKQFLINLKCETMILNKNVSILINKQNIQNEDILSLSFSLDSLLLKYLVPAFADTLFGEINFVKPSFLVQNFNQSDIQKIKTEFKGQVDLSSVKPSSIKVDLSNVAFIASIYELNFNLQASIPNGINIASIGNISDPKLILDAKFSLADGKFKIISSDLRLGGLANMEVPHLGLAKIQLNSKFVQDGINVSGNIIDPLKIKPLGKTNFPLIKDLEFSNLRIKTNFEKPKAPGLKPISTIAFGGDVNLPAPFKLKTFAEIRSILKPDGKPDFLGLVSMPKDFTLADIFPELKQIPLANLIFSDLDLIISNYDAEFNFKNFNIKVIKGFNFGGKLQELKIGTLFPAFRGTVLDNVIMKNILLTLQVPSLEDLKKPQMPSFTINGRIDLSKLGLPNIPTQSLTDLPLILDFNPEGTLNIAVSLGEKITIDSIGEITMPRILINATPSTKIFDIKLGGIVAIDIPVLNKKVAVNLDAQLKNNIFLLAGAITQPEFIFPFEKLALPILQELKLSQLKVASEIIPSIQPAKLPALSLELGGLILIPDPFNIPVQGFMKAISLPTGKKEFGFVGAFKPNYGLNTPNPKFNFGVAVPILKNTPLGRINFNVLQLGITSIDLPNVPDFGNMTKGFNFKGELSKISFGELFPELAATPLNAIKFIKCGLTINDLPSLQSLKKGLPSFKINGMADLSDIASLLGLPSTDLTKLGVSLEYFSTGGFNLTTKIGLAEFSITGDLKNKTFQISGDTKINFTIPLINKDVELDLSSQIGDGEMIEVDIVKPLNLSPFSMLPGLKDISALQNVSFSKMRFRAQANILDAIKNKKIMPASFDFELMGDINLLNTPMSCSLRFIMVNKKIENVILTANFSDKWRLSQSVPQLKGTVFDNITLKNAGIIINLNNFTQEIKELNMQVPLTQGISLYGTIDKLKLSTLLPDIPSEFDKITGNNVLLMIKNFNPSVPEKPSVFMRGSFDFSSFDIPMIGEKLIGLDTTIDFDLNKELILDARLKNSFKLPQNIGEIKSPSLQLVAQMDPKISMRDRFSFMLKANTSVNIPVVSDIEIAGKKLGRFDALVEFEYANKKFTERLRFKKDLSFYNIKMSDVYLEFVSVDPNNLAFNIFGKSMLKGQDVLSRFTFIKGGKLRSGGIGNIEQGFYIEYEGLTDLKNVNPFDVIPDLKNLKSQVPAEFKNVKLKEISFGVSLGATEKLLFVSGLADLYEIEQRLSFFIITNDLGQTGVIVQSSLDATKFAISDVIKLFKEPIKKTVPGLSDLVFAKMVEGPLLKALKCPAIGLLVSTIPYSYNMSRSLGLTPFKTEDGYPQEMSSGLIVFGRLKIDGEIKNNKVFGLDNLVMNPSSEAGFFMTFGITPADWRLMLSLENGILKYQLPGISIAPGPMKFEVSLTPSLAAIISVLMRPEDQIEPLLFSGRLEFRPSQMLVEASLTMQGIWNNPFGFEYLRFGNVAGELSWDVPIKFIAGVVGELVGDFFTSGGSAGTSGTASSGAAPTYPVGGGFTFDVEIGKLNDPIKKHCVCAVSLTKEAQNIMFDIKEIGSMGKKDINRFADILLDLTSVLQKGFKFLTQIIPLPQESARLNGPLIKELSNAQKFAIKQDVKDPSSILSDMINSNFSKSPNLPKFEDVLNGVAAFANDVKSKGDLATKWIQSLPDLEIIDPELRYAMDNVQIGEIWFERGLAIKCTLEMLGKRAGSNVVVSMNGISGERFVSTLDLGAIISDKFKGQLIIDGAGVDGKYGTSDDGPAEAINLNLDKQGIVYTGRIFIKPFDCSADGEVRVMNNELLFKGVFNLFGLYQVDLDVIGKTIGGKADILMNGIFNSDFVNELTSKTRLALNKLDMKALPVSYNLADIFNINSVNFNFSFNDELSGKKPTFTINTTVLDNKYPLVVTANIKENLDSLAKEVASQIYGILKEPAIKLVQVKKDITDKAIEVSDKLTAAITRDKEMIHEFSQKTFDEAINKLKDLNKNINNLLTGFSEAFEKNKVRVEVTIEE